MASPYHRGDMDISEQVSTFHLVMNLTKWGSLHLAALLIFLVLWFCTPTGFVGALVAGVVVMGLGIVLLRGGGTKAAH
ncbi:MAG: aa3-type cytochrome c oxidase subunit IV [Phenylobacterium sp.]